MALEGKEAWGGLIHSREPQRDTWCEHTVKDPQGVIPGQSWVEGNPPCCSYCMRQAFWGWGSHWCLCRLWRPLGQRTNTVCSIIQRWPLTSPWMYTCPVIPQTQDSFFFFLTFYFALDYSRGSNQSILKKISPGCSLEGLMLKLKLQYFGHLMWRVDSLERPWRWEGLGAGGEGDERGWDGWMASLTWWA